MNIYLLSLLLYKFLIVVFSHNVIYLLIRAALTEGDQLMSSPPFGLMSSWRRSFKNIHNPVHQLRKECLLMEIC